MRGRRGRSQSAPSAYSDVPGVYRAAGGIVITLLPDQLARLLSLADEDVAAFVGWAGALA